MEKREIINIVNFIRAVEPRSDVDLHEPVAEQIRLMREHNLRGTFLLQYDALISPGYTDLLKSLDPAQFEVGVWFETVQPLVEKAGLVWRGRYAWDWHAHCGFSVGYTKTEREALADILFNDFKDIFGYYPRVFGSWFFDSHTIRYISDKYGLDAICNCKEQYGTDGYTLWGGYYGQGYYPSRRNVFMPAQSEREQIPVPLFRMLGSDPVYQYDFGMSAEKGASSVQGVITLEPVYNGGGGGVPAWVDWYMRENFNGDCLSFGYAQAGQENSFGWKSMRDGLEYQFALFDKLCREGKLTVETLGDTGRWYKKTYSMTPASAITAHSAYDDDDKSSVWYSSRFYRINLYCAHGGLRIRDLHVFSEKCADPYEDTVCENNEAAYETLPIADGNRYSGNGVLSGIYFTDKASGKQLSGGETSFRELGNGSAELSYGGIVIRLDENSVTVTAPSDFILTNRIGKDGNHLPEVKSADKKNMSLEYNGTAYGLSLRFGVFTDRHTVMSENKTVTATFTY